MARKVRLYGKKLNCNMDVAVTLKDAVLINDFFSKTVADELNETMKRTYMLNGRNVSAFNPEKDKLISLRWNSKDLESDDLISDGFEIADERGMVWVGRIPEYLPKAIFEDYKEGETIAFNIPIWLRRICNENEKTYITLKAKLTLNQNGSAYASLGNFEDAVAAK